MIPEEGLKLAELLCIAVHEGWVTGEEAARYFRNYAGFPVAEREELVEA